MSSESLPNPDPAPLATPLWSASAQLAAMRAGEISSEELTKSYLDRIGKHNASINAVVALDAEAR